VANSELFFYCLIFFLAGIVTGSFLFLEGFYLFCLFLILFFCSLIFFSRNRFFYVLIMATVFVFGWWRYDLSLPDCSRPKNLCYHNGQNVAFIGKIAQVSNSPDSQRLEISAFEVEADNMAVSGKIQTTTGIFPKFNVGDIVSVNCELQGLEEIKQSGFAKYLSSRRVYSSCWNPEITVLDSSSASIAGFWGMVRRFLSERINLTLPEPTASLIRGMMLGDGAGMPKYLKDRFSRLGLTHVIAISGSHIAIVCSVLLACFLTAGVSRPRSFWPIFWIVVFYVILVGAPASAVRSAIMGLMILFSQKIGRLSRSKNVLISAAALMALENPQIIIGDVGFQLSFAAVWGLIYITPIIKKHFSIFPEFLQLREIVVATCAAQLSTMPLILFHFGNFSFISFFANLLILPAIPLLTVLGLAQTVVAGISVLFGKIIGFPVWVICVYWLEVSKWLDGLPFSDWGLGQISLLSAIISYLIIFVWVWLAGKKMV